MKAIPSSRRSIVSRLNVLKDQFSKEYYPLDSDELDEDNTVNKDNRKRISVTVVDDWQSNLNNEKLYYLFNKGASG